MLRQLQQRAGFRVFIDFSMGANVHVRDEIKGNVRTSRVVLLLLTDQYMRRRWTLVELQLAMEARARGVEVIPLYYGVKKEDLAATGPMAEEWRQVWEALERESTDEMGRAWEADERIDPSKGRAALDDLWELNGVPCPPGLEEKDAYDRFLLKTIAECERILR